MKQQTAVEWLAEQITTVKWKMSDVTDRNSIIEQAKAMEKEQIIKAYENTNSMAMYGEQYYNETYESKTNL
jgi:hypothetical protein